MTNNLNTVKNVYFYSETRSEKIPFKKIMATTNYCDGIGIQKDDKTAKPAVFKMAAHPEDGWFVCNVISNLLEFIRNNFDPIIIITPTSSKERSFRGNT